jgi:hypothetical protein
MVSGVEELASHRPVLTVKEMRTNSRPQLNPAGQGPARPKKDRLPALGVAPYHGVVGDRRQPETSSALQAS